MPKQTTYKMPTEEEKKKIKKVMKDNPGMSSKQAVMIAFNMNKK